MARPRPIPENSRIDPAMLERTLRTYHEWGYASALMVAQFLREGYTRCVRYTNILHDAGYLIEMGNPRVPPGCAIKGKWYTVTRRSVSSFESVPTRHLIAIKDDNDDSPGGRYNIQTNGGFVIPRHQAWVSYSASWIASMLPFHFGVAFAVESEHLIRTRMGQNSRLTEAQKVALQASIHSLESQNTTVPDARFLVPETKTVFRMETECSDKSARRLQQLKDLYQSAQVPILYVHLNARVLKQTALHLPESSLIRHIKVDDVGGFVRAMWTFGLDKPFMLHGNMDSDVSYPPGWKAKS